MTAPQSAPLPGSSLCLSLCRSAAPPLRPAPQNSAPAHHSCYPPCCCLSPARQRRCTHTRQPAAEPDVRVCKESAPTRPTLQRGGALSLTLAACVRVRTGLPLLSCSSECSLGIPSQSNGAAGRVHRGSCRHNTATGGEWARGMGLAHLPIASRPRSAPIHEPKLGRNDDDDDDVDSWRRRVLSTRSLALAPFHCESRLCRSVLRPPAGRLLVGLSSAPATRRPMCCARDSSRAPCG